MNKTLIACIITILLTIGSAFAQDTDTTNPAGKGKKWEQNRQAFLDQFDTDGDGTISETEREAARTYMAENGRPGGRGQGQQGRRGPTAEQRQQIMERFDTDGDGQLNETERAAAREAMQGRGGQGRGGPSAEQRTRILEQYDTDGDGQLNETERAAAREAMQGQGRGGQGQQGRRGPTAEQRQQIMERFDTDGDGQLNETERAAARAEMQKRRGGGE